MASGDYRAGYRGGYRSSYYAGYPGTGADPTPPSPPSSGLALWLKADAGVDAPTGNVLTWADQSGGGNDYVQGTPAKQPTLVTGAIHGLPAIKFDGVAQFLTSSFQIGGAKTVVFVRKLPTTPAPAQGRSLYTVKSSGGDFTEATFLNVGAPYTAYSTCHDFAPPTSTGSVGNAAALDTAWHATIDTYNAGGNADPASYTLTLDAAAQTVSASGIFGRVATDVPSIGARASATNTGTSFCDLEVAEFLVWDHVLSAPDIATVRAYLTGRYGI